MATKRHNSRGGMRRHDYHGEWRKGPPKYVKAGANDGVQTYPGKKSERARRNIEKGRGDSAVNKVLQKRNRSLQDGKCGIDYVSERQNLNRWRSEVGSRRGGLTQLKHPRRNRDQKGTLDVYQQNKQDITSPRTAKQCIHVQGDKLANREG